MDFLTVADLEYADTIDPAGISTWANAVEGLGQFRNKGGKVITFHGTRDPVCHPFRNLMLRNPLTGVFYLFTGDTLCQLQAFLRAIVVQNPILR